MALFCLAVSWRAPAQESQTSPPDTLIHNWPARARLEAGGVRPYAILTSEVWGNVAGGLKTGAWWEQLLDFGVEFDTAKLGGWQGGSFLAQLHWAENSDHNGSFADYTGAISPVSGIMAAQHFRVFNLYFLQRWCEDAVVLKAGQLAADDDFMCSSYTGLFLNSAFGALPSQVGNRLGSCCGFSPAFPIYPVAAPGLFLSVRPAQAFYIQTALYYGRPGFDTPNNYGFDWVSQTPAEAGTFLEAGYTWHISSHVATTRLGGTYHTGRLQDFGAINAGEPAATKQNEPNFYAVQDLELLRSAEGKTRLGLFWRGGVTPSPDRSMVGAYTDGGLNWFGPLPGRPDDVAGVGISYTRFGSEFRESTGPNGLAASETTLEISYKAQVARWLSLQADVQLLFNPAINPESGSRETATVLGLRARMTF
jgi:porin